MMHFPRRIPTVLENNASFVVLVCTCYRLRCTLPCKTPLQFTPSVVRPELLNALVPALNNELVTYSSVVLPFTHNYPIISAILQSMTVEVDSDVLNEQDTALYNFLCVHFEVHVVSVCYQCVDGTGSSCILGHSTTSTGGTDDTGTEVVNDADVNDAVLIAPLPRGLGTTSTRTTFGRNSSDKTVTLVTGLHITRKLNA